MADLSITISNTMSLIGAAPANVWGTMLWGDNWGSSEDFELTIGKWLSESLTFTDSVFKEARFTINESISISSSMNLGFLQDSSGYKYIEQGVSDPDDRIFPSFTEQTGSSPTYTADSDSDPGWSNA